MGKAYRDLLQYTNNLLYSALPITARHPHFPTAPSRSDQATYLPSSLSDRRPHGHSTSKSHIFSFAPSLPLFTNLHPPPFLPPLPPTPRLLRNPPQAPSDPLSSPSSRPSPLRPPAPGPNSPSRPLRIPPEFCPCCSWSSISIERAPCRHEWGRCAGTRWGAGGQVRAFWRGHHKLCTRCFEGSGL